MIRPILRGEVIALDGNPIPALFLVDTGADRTVLDGDTLFSMGEDVPQAEQWLGGVGGVAEGVVVDGQIRLTDQDGRKVAFNGQFAAIASSDTLDMYILGRDITALFAVIVDEPGDRLCLVRPPNAYRVEGRAST